jgi:predicted membrane channel-forming protein YqfA (hemolysin III family)
MIQRIQTLWLLLTAACAFISLKLPFYTGNEMENQSSVFKSLTASSPLLINIITVIIGVFAIVFIFFFKNRKRQLWLTFLLFVLTILQIVLLYFQTSSFVQGPWAISILIYIALPILLILALRGIYKDEQLVKSVDRLR